MFLIINKNSQKSVYLTLAEKATLPSPYYLFNFVSVDSNESVLFTAPDLSTNTDRYNLFTITETGGTQNFTAGTITLTPGEWNYYIYEMSGSTNLAISGTTSMVEQGQVFVSASTSTSYTYTGNDDSENTVYFNN